MAMHIDLEKVHQLRGHNAAIYRLANDQQGASFLSSGGDGWIVRWSIDDPDPGHLVARVEQQVFSLCNLADKGLLIAGDMNGGIHWVYPEDQKRNRHIAHHKKGVFDLRQIGAFVYSLGGQGTLTRWSIEAARSLESLQLSYSALRAIDYNARRKELAIGASDSNIYLLDADTLEIRKVIDKAHEPSVFSVHYTPDGQHLLSGGRDAHLRVWDCEHGFEVISDQAAHWYTINHICFHPRGHLFATASRDKSIKIWDASNFKLLKVLDQFKKGGHLNSVNRLLWVAGGQQLVSASDDRSLIIWDLKDD
ncbi:MAG: WD40 repeat domain-containing protein [Bacteroidota bacterium]